MEPKQVVCDLCGKRMLARGFSTHRGKVPCQIWADQALARKLGMVWIHGQWRGTLERNDIPFRYFKHKLVAGGPGEHSSKIQMATYAPKEVVHIIDEHRYLRNFGFVKILTNHRIIQIRLKAMLEEWKCRQ